MAIAIERTDEFELGDERRVVFQAAGVKPGAGGGLGVPLAGPPRIVTSGTQAAQACRSLSPNRSGAASGRKPARAADCAAARCSLRESSNCAGQPVRGTQTDCPVSRCCPARITRRRHCFLACELLAPERGAGRNEVRSHADPTIAGIENVCLMAWSHSIRSCSGPPASSPGPWRCFRPLVRWCAASCDCGSSTGHDAGRRTAAASRAPKAADHSGPAGRSSGPRMPASTAC